MLSSQPLVLDAVHQGLLLAAVDDLGGQLDEPLRIAKEVIETPAGTQNSLDAAPRQLRPVLKLGDQVGKLDVFFS